MTRIWTWLKDDLGTTLGTILNGAIVVTGIVVVWLDMTGRASPEAVREATLGLLSLIGASLLVNRTTDNQLQQTTGKILKRMQKPYMDEILMSYGDWIEEIRQRLASADEVWIVSRTCMNLWKVYKNEFSNLLEKDRVVRFLLVDPNNAAVEMIAQSVEEWEAPDDPKQMAENIKNFLRRLQVSQPTLQKRIIDYLPAWTLVLVDPKSAEGVIYVELGTYTGYSSSRPMFLLSAERDERLFEMFLREFKTMWERAAPPSERTI